MIGPTDKDVWKIFIGEEEQLIQRGDQWGRILFKDRSTEQVKDPIVSNRLFSNGFLPHYPEGHSFAVCISHDVDHLLRPDLPMSTRLKETVKELLGGYVKRSVQYLRPGDPINPDYNIGKVLEIEKKFNIESSFYFMALRPGEPDFNYSLHTTTSVLREVMSNRCEIGLHGGHTAFFDIAKLWSEKEELEAVTHTAVKGYRNHFLRFNAPNTWEMLSNAGFRYDTTYGFPDYPGFRNGMCYPFFPYSAQSRRFSDILEIPLIVMDATFIYYLKYDEKQSFKVIADTIDKVRKVKGVFTLLWHNNYLYKPWRDLFKLVLSYCRDNDAWFATGEQIDEWWREQSFCSQYSTFGLKEDSQHL